ncbi:SOS response-associated peptidase [Microbacterium sp. KUDC0406]|uniref:SOS response-associated peptidase n=1 Tax=Microbacterium sp. KUDC0406 TaxID=2909588 RepID=UPI001F333BF7|nr:SOS response-associated peptidase [Microbacterium sp. KUDC0406]UJP09304.1 SOS response-associated peptidase [Microbacterium sp. KUDC0406]
MNTEITEFVQRTGRRPEEWAPNWEAAYNIAPTEQIPVLIDSAKTGELRFETARWSLAPAWSPTLKLKLPTFNARAEGMAEKTTWRKPWQTHRAIVLARGFFEWTGERGSKTPWFMSHPNGALMGFAGLCSWWPDPTKDKDDPERWTLTATIVTSDAVQTLAGIHDRTPVILPEHMWLQWIDPSVVGDQALAAPRGAPGAGRPPTRPSAQSLTPVQLRLSEQPVTVVQDSLHIWATHGCASATPTCAAPSWCAAGRRMP